MTYFYNLSCQWFSKQFLHFCQSLKASLYTGLKYNLYRKKTVIQCVKRNNIQSYFIRRQTVLKHLCLQNLRSCIQLRRFIRAVLQCCPQFSETYLEFSKEHYNKLVIIRALNIKHEIVHHQPCTVKNEIIDKMNDMKNENLNPRKPRMQFIIQATAYYTHTYSLSCKAFSFIFLLL